MVGLSRQSKWASAARCLSGSSSMHPSSKTGGAAELHRGRQNDRRAEREERLDHIRRYSTTANQSAAGKSWVCRELNQMATVRYFHIQIGIFTFQHIEMAWARHSKKNIPSRFKRKSPNRELSPTRYISWQSKAAGNICS